MWFHSSPQESGTGSSIILGKRGILRSTFRVPATPNPICLFDTSEARFRLPDGLPDRSQRPIPEHNVCKKPGVASAFSGSAEVPEPERRTWRSHQAQPGTESNMEARGWRPAARGTGRGWGLTRGGARGDKGGDSTSRGAAQVWDTQVNPGPPAVARLRGP